MFPPMTMLVELQREHDQQREQLRRQTRDKVERALQELLPGQVVFIFGSLLKCGAFHAQSDVDLAVFEVPSGASEFALHGMLEERIGCPVDLLLLPEHRLKDKIQHDGELWIGSSV